MNRKLSLIAAVAQNGVIGNNGTLPWHISKDFAWFVKQTTGKVVVMGRKNYEDIIKFTKGKPLKDRVNIIITTNKDLKADGFIVLNNINDVLEQYPDQDLMIIGGTQIYKEFLPYANQIILTEIHKEFEGDVFFPEWNKDKFIQTYKQTEFEKDFSYDFCIYDIK